jgi:nitroimidazol reductase NimA-like FMN-containing flavoprotein (pyridoxamine 5'-phosphate oxidase superfamily)
MTSANREILAIIAEGQDMTVATLRPDGWPQATTVSYASSGCALYFGCGSQSQKCANLTRDDRVSATITLPYRDWSCIRALSLAGRARRIVDPDELARVGLLFMEKFPETAQYVSADGDLAMFEILPTVVSLLDYRRGFGHTEEVTGPELVG